MASGTASTGLERSTLILNIFASDSHDDLRLGGVTAGGAAGTVSGSNRSGILGASRLASAAEGGDGSLNDLAAGGEGEGAGVAVRDSGG